jgi:hypothetical protein
MDQPAAYSATLVEMSDEFRQNIIERYAQWRRILGIVDPESPTPKSSSDLPQGRELDTLTTPDSAPLTEVKDKGIRFSYNEGLIYFHDANGSQRVCIPRSLHKEILHLAHDEHAHSGFPRTYKRVAGSLYLRRLSDSLKQYIRHCPECQVNQTKRHPPYGGPYAYAVLDNSVPHDCYGFCPCLAFNDLYFWRIGLPANRHLQKHQASASASWKREMGGERLG